MTVNPLPPAFHIMVKPRGAICNLDCQYCFFLKKEQLYPESSFRMTDELLEDYTSQMIAAQRAPEVTFAWQGGEPTLMGLDFFRKAVEFQHKYRKPGMRVHNAFQTNGTLLDDEWAEFFRQNDFLIGVSLDGPSHLHNAYRVDKGGKSTFDRVMAGLKVLQTHQVNYNILACVSSANAGTPLEVYRFFRDEVGAQYIQFIPIVERENETGYQEGTRVTKRTVTGQQYGRFLIEIFNEWVRRDVGKVYVQMFDVCLAVWVGEKAGLCIFEETCGTALALEHTGDLYSCDHFVEPRFLLGNIGQSPLEELVVLNKQVKFGLDKRDSLPEYCRKCPVRFMCNGGCPKDRILRTPDGEPGLNYLCEGFKAFFTYIDGPMKIMAGLLRMNRAPAEIMDLLADEKSGGDILPPVPNLEEPKKRKRSRR